jgi:hypothetical protein
MAMSETPKKEIKTDEIADRMAREHRQGLIRLTGRFLGNSEHEGYYRLYLTEQMDRYLEFSKDGTVEAERFPSGRLVVWLKPGTPVVNVASRPVSQEFLSGSIGAGASRRPRGVVRTMMAAAGDGCGYSSLIPANCPDTGPATITCNPNDPAPGCPYNM